MDIIPCLSHYINPIMPHSNVPIVLGRAGNIGDYFPSEAREIIGDVPCST